MGRRRLLQRHGLTLACCLRTHSARNSPSPVVRSVKEPRGERRPGNHLVSHSKRHTKKGPPKLPFTFFPPSGLTVNLLTHSRRQTPAAFSCSAAAGRTPGSLSSHGQSMAGRDNGPTGPPRIQVAPVPHPSLFAPPSRCCAPVSRCRPARGNAERSISPRLGRCDPGHCFLRSSLRNCAASSASSASRTARPPYSRNTSAASTNLSTSFTTISTSRFQL